MLRGRCQPSSQAPSYYEIPELKDVPYNGESRINQKTQQLLKKLIDGIKGAETIIADEVGKGARGKNIAEQGGWEWYSTEEE